MGAAFIALQESNLTIWKIITRECSEIGKESNMDWT